MKIFHVSAKIMYASLFKYFIDYTDDVTYGLRIERSSAELPVHTFRNGSQGHNLYSRSQVPVFGIKPEVLSRLKEKMLPVDKLLEGLECTVAYKVSDYVRYPRESGRFSGVEAENVKKYIPVAVNINEPLCDFNYWEYEALLKGKL